MRKLVALGLVVFGGVIVTRLLPRDLRARPSVAMRHWMAKHVEQMMASLPANAPPKLVMSILPKLQAQHEQIIALLQEQNALLRQRQPAAPG